MKKCMVVLVLALLATAWSQEKPPQATQPAISQPDYRAWQQIEVGMTEEQVTALLGEPVEKNGDPSKIPDLLYSWAYGRLTPVSPAFADGMGKPSFIHFQVRFQHRKVWCKEDPFSGQFSPDGKPTTPRLFSPPDDTLFSQYPRYMDLRWYPSSGEYPMRYEVELNDHDVIRTDIPYLAIQAGGAGKSKWRVRAINRLGTSDWSEYGTYQFAQ